MKFFTFALAFLASGTYASVLRERSSEPIKTVVTDITKDIDSLAAVVNSFPASGKGSIQRAAVKLNSDLTEGTATVESSEKLTPEEASGLATAIQGLIQKTQDLANLFKSFRPAAEEVNACVLVYSNLQTTIQEARDFMSAVASKMPAEAEASVADNVHKLLSVFEDLQKYYSPENCKNSDGSAAPSN
ncbi:cell wall protein [Metarhizium album ARSEF 1941]|uniref:Cell wall protein n=1 Tax=Metarhizium album (strain ARSEF 1941) TaxID=1081103 RepID=A0A0B2WL69_METAS|nr:cell wall protein [Metarhizium album ARSEF 1941]KHN96791.1 cell wall protein [Metarhizium album ARSEF 1941]